MHKVEDIYKYYLMLSGGKKSNMNQRFVSQGTNVLYQPGLRKQLHLQWILFSLVVWLFVVFVTVWFADKMLF